MNKRTGLSLLCCLAGLCGRADVVHVFEQTECGGETAPISERSLVAGMPWSTQATPVKSGYIFTHWTISTTQDFAARDEWGRAFDAATFMLYEDTTLTAHYLPATQDEDGDGIADGHEIYWYGSTDASPSSDTDGDGFTFAEELANGTNPLMADADVEGPVRYADGELLQYNPLNMPTCVIRSEPEGGLFETYSDVLRVGTYVTSETMGSFSPETDKFAYWTVDGVQQRDEWGRAVDLIAFNMPTAAVEIVAVTADDEEARWKLYWYGTTDVSMDSDTDGDGVSFADELVRGTNPLMADADVEGPVRYADGELLQYNPLNMPAYTIRSEPEGTLFETVTEYVRAGMTVEPDAYSPCDSTFAYWTKNGAVLRDEWGRALDSAAFQMPTEAVEVVAVTVDDAEARQKLYWYGTTDVSMESDTDGDGVSFADEIARGTNPLMIDADVEGPVRYADSELHEVNLQPFEQAQGAIVGGEYQSLFHSPAAGNDGCQNFGPETVPNVVDVNGDGLFDLVVASKTGHVVLVNVGTAGNPQFERRTDVATNGLALAKGGLERLDGLDLDVRPTDAVSCTFGDVDQDGVEDLLVSDAEGRIWYYKGVKDENGESTESLASLKSFVLQHKVWGGSGPGFANKLYLAAVDWDGDGDLDCVCGTAEGRLMLLVDPRIGRPTNVRARPGVDSVVLEWDASVNSRVRGYGVYRGATSNDCVQVQSLWLLPTYRDVPEVLQDYYYRVTSMGRHYVAGNSAPIVSESMPTDAVFVQFRPSVWLNDASAFAGSDVEMIVSMNNSMGISADGFSMTFEYDPEVLTPVAMRTTGLTDKLEFGEAKAKGEGERWNWTLSATGGEIGTGAGRFLRLAFHVKSVRGVAETTVSITAATVKAGDGRTVTLDLPKSAKIAIDSQPLVPAGVAMNVSTVYADTLSTFSLPIVVTSTKTLTKLTVDVGWDANLIEFKGAANGSMNGNTLTVSGTVPSVIYLTFYAKDQHEVDQTTVTLGNASAVCIDGLDAKITTVNGTVHLTDSNVPEPVTMTVASWDSKAKSGESFKVRIGATTSGDLATLTVDVDWDASQLTFNGCPSAKSVTVLSANSRRFVFDCTGNYNLFNLDFTAPTISGLQTSSWTRVVSASGVGRNGLAAIVQTELPRTGNVMIVREVGRYDPGDIDGDGAYTANDLLILNGYYFYLQMAAMGAAMGNNYATGYQKQYGINVKLSGSAARAADVNCDGAVTTSDIVMLQMLIREAEGAGE